MNESERAAIIEQGRQAKTILDTPLFNEAINEMRASCMERLESQRTYDEAAIGALWRQLKSINMFKELIKTKLDHAVIEQRHAEQDKNNAQY